MGVFISRLTELFSKCFNEPVRILMLGLDGTGKTTILYNVKLNRMVNTIPTIGFNVETVTPVKGVTFTVWDVGGQDKNKVLYRHYYQDAEGLLFVVDSTDSGRLSKARNELDSICKEMSGVPVVVLANKHDLSGSMSTTEIVDGLNLRHLTDRKWIVQATCAVTGEGVSESMHEMARLVKAFKQDRWQKKI